MNIDIQNIIRDFESSADEIYAEIAKGLDRKRGSYLRKHTTTGKTAKSTKMQKGRFDGADVTWDFHNKSGYHLNKGGEVPFTNGGGGERNPNSAYIGAIIKWVGVKYGKFGEDARRLAFQIANSAREGSQSNIIKHTGWFNDIKHKVDKLCTRKVNLSIRFGIEEILNKNLPKKIN